MLRKTHLTYLLAIGAIATIGGCNSTTAPPAVERRVTLTAFDSCSDLESYIHEAAVEQMRQTVEAYAEGSFGGGVARSAGPDVFLEAAPSAAADDASGPAAHTETNNQVAGVNEADFVKNDGSRIFVLSNNVLYAAKSWPPEDLAVVGKLQLEGQPTEMFFEANKDRLVVISQLGNTYGYDHFGGPVADQAILCAEGFDCGAPVGPPQTKLTTIDVSALDSPKVIAEIQLPGSYSNGRRIGSTVRLVLRDGLHFPQGLNYYPGDPDDASTDDLIAQNEKLIRSQSLEAWLPAAQVRTDGDPNDVRYECARFHKSNAITSLGLASIATINLDDPTRIHHLSVVAEPAEIYASAEALYITSQHYWWRPVAGESDHTYIHKFDTQQEDETRYVASGAVAGHLLNQFAMDEHQGYLRIATTINTNSDDPEAPWVQQTTNRVSVLAESEGQLNVIGQTKDIAAGERIYSARFIGDKGYVVTFRQVDPLFTIDLSPPESPRVVGELKVPGFSTYIHPIGDDYLLTIGTHIPDPSDREPPLWDGPHVKLTLFDVSSFSEPKEKFTKLVGSFSGSSEATYEHRAFNYFPESGLLAIPFQDYEHQLGSGDEPYWDAFVSDLRVFHVDTDKGIDEAGALGFRDLFRARDGNEWSPYYSPWVRRSVMAKDDEGNDFVFGVSDAGIRVGRVGALDKPIATATFIPPARK